MNEAFENIFTNESLYASIPEEGSLGLLALGAVGLIAWRRRRDALRQVMAAEGDHAQGAIHG